METIIEILMAALKAGILVGGGNKEGEYSFAVADAKDTVHIMVRPTGRATIATAETDEEQTYDLNDPDAAANFVTDISSMLMDENLDSKAVQFMQIITDAADAEGGDEEDEAEDTEDTEGEDGEEGEEVEEASVPSPFTNGADWLDGIETAVASLVPAKPETAALRPLATNKPRKSDYPVRWYIYQGPKAKSFSKPVGKGKTQLKLAVGALYGVQYNAATAKLDATYTIFAGSAPNNKFKVTFTVGTNLVKASTTAYVKEQADGTFIVDKAFNDAGDALIVAFRQSAGLRTPVISAKYLDWLHSVVRGLGVKADKRPTPQALAKVSKMLTDGPGASRELTPLKSLDERTVKAIKALDTAVTKLVRTICDTKTLAEAKSLRGLKLAELQDLYDTIELSLMLRKGDVGRAHKRYGKTFDSVFDWADPYLIDYFDHGPSVKAKDIEAFALKFCQSKAAKGVKVTTKTTFAEMKGGDKGKGGDLANDLLDAIDNRLNVYFYMTTKYLPNTIEGIVKQLVKTKENQVVASAELACSACDESAKELTGGNAIPSMLGSDPSLRGLNYSPFNLGELQNVTGPNTYFRQLKLASIQAGHNVCYNFFDGLCQLCEAHGSVPGALFDLAEEYKLRLLSYVRLTYSDLVAKEIEGALIG